MAGGAGRALFTPPASTLGRGSSVLPRPRYDDWNDRQSSVRAGLLSTKEICDPFSSSHYVTRRSADVRQRASTPFSANGSAPLATLPGSSASAVLGEAGVVVAVVPAGPERTRSERTRQRRPTVQEWRPSRIWRQARASKVVRGHWGAGKSVIGRDAKGAGASTFRDHGAEAAAPPRLRPNRLVKSFSLTLLRSAIPGPANNLAKNQAQRRPRPSRPNPARSSNNRWCHRTAHPSMSYPDPHHREGPGRHAGPYQCVSPAGELADSGHERPSRTSGTWQGIYPFSHKTTIRTSHLFEPARRWRLRMSRFTWSASGVPSAWSVPRVGGFSDEFTIVSP